MKCKHGIKPRLKEKEKVVVDVDNENYQLNDNWSHIYFECHATFDNCFYYVEKEINDGDYEYKTCKYYSNCRCNSSAAQTNAMIMELKRMGFKTVSLNNMCNWNEIGRDLHGSIYMVSCVGETVNLFSDKDRYKYCPFCGGEIGGVNDR